jgi:hypothetical protein
LRPNLIIELGPDEVQGEKIMTETAASNTGFNKTVSTRLRQHAI